MSDRAEPDSPLTRDTLVHNERVKLAATYLNGLGIAVAAIGGLTPLVGGNGLAGLSFGEIAVKIAGAALCLTFSFLLHLGASNLLKSLR